MTAWSFLTSEGFRHQKGPKSCIFVVVYGIPNMQSLIYIFIINKIKINMQLFGP